MNPNEPKPLQHDELDAAVPGGVYLCQVGETVSCGACCGLYNVSDITRHTLSGRLENRSALFRSVSRTVQDIDRFAREIAFLESDQRPFEKFHHCPFIGLIGDRLSRVGCLLHPMADGNHGVDFRGLSYYGGMACRTYFCPATHGMMPRYKKVLRHIADDWFLYGMVVTEKELVESLFGHVEEILKEHIDTAVVRAGTRAREALNSLLAIKFDWPYRPSPEKTACHYFFDDGSYTRQAVDYGRLTAVPGRYDTIFKELGSVFETDENLADAEAFIDAKIMAAVRCLTNSSYPSR